jgi:glucosamine--fructose-6-phosphate aminotransferase (isomerizing)
MACRISCQYVFEEFARIPVEVEYASEFRYRNNINKKISPCFSQSGETADTNKISQEHGAFVWCL